MLYYIVLEYSMYSIWIVLSFPQLFFRFPHGGENYLHIEKPVEVLRALWNFRRKLAGRTHRIGISLRSARSDGECAAEALPCSVSGSLCAVRNRRVRFTGAVAQ